MPDTPKPNLGCDSTLQDLKSAELFSRTLFGRLRTVDWWISDIATDSPGFVSRTFAALCQFQGECNKDESDIFTTLTQVEEKLAGFRRQFPTANVGLEDKYFRPSATTYARELFNWVALKCHVANVNEFISHPACSRWEPKTLSSQIELLMMPMETGIENYGRQRLNANPTWEGIEWWLVGSLVPEPNEILKSCQAQGCSVSHVMELILYFLDHYGEFTESELGQRLRVAAPELQVDSGWPPHGLRSLMNSREWLGSQAVRIALNEQGKSIQERFRRINWSLFDSELRGEYAAIKASENSGCAAIDDIASSTPMGDASKEIQTDAEVQLFTEDELEKVKAVHEQHGYRVKNLRILSAIRETHGKAFRPEKLKPIHEQLESDGFFNSLIPGTTGINTEH